MKNNYCTLYIIRHGQSQANYPHDLYGLDKSLTEKGREQAKNAAEIFKKLQFDAIFSSPLARAKETAEIIATEHKLAILTKEMLRDRRFGEIEGRKTKEVREELEELFNQRNKLPYKKWKTTRFAKGYETDEEMISRFITALREISIAYTGKTVLIASHVSLIRTFLIHLGLKKYKDFELYTFENAGCIKLTCDGVDFFVEEINGLKKKG
jgi:broad specificity phosphatase PhoE